MRRRSIRHNLEATLFAFCLGICFFASSAILAQPGGAPQQPVTHHSEEATPKETTMRGCVGGRPNDRFYYLVADDTGYFYFLDGDTSLLKGYVGKEISVRGKETKAALPGSFDVTSVKQVFDVPCPTLKPSFSGAAWHTEKNRKYGIEFSYPDDLTPIQPPILKPVWFDSNFATDQKVVHLAELKIPWKVYHNTNFAGGSFAIFVNPEIGNGPSCRQFGFYYQRLTPSYAVHRIHYTEARRGTAATGTEFSEYRFHTFQNGLCYELAFVLSEIDPGMSEHKSRVLREMDEWSLVQALIERVQFLRPSVTPENESNPNAVPRITRFVASSHTADGATNRGEITFSWTTQDADYVELSFKCIPPMAGRLPAAVVLENGYPDGCGNASPHFKDTAVKYRAPNSSRTILFGDNRPLDPITIIVKLTPYSYGKAYPGSAMSIPIKVNPRNPFPEGVPAPDGNVVLSYPVRADGTTELQQGTSLTIHWTEATPRDSCVNLYLVQDVGGGKWAYRMQLPDRCFSPARGGSHTWTIPDRFSGAGFRIYAREPGGPASGFGAPFSIVPATPGR